MRVRVRCLYQDPSLEKGQPMNRLGTSVAFAVALGLAPLPAPASTSGVVGVTVDCATGNTIPYAHVIVRAYGSVAPERDLTSNAAGRFTALGLNPGLYYIAVQGARGDAAYWGPHNLKLETNDIQHVQVGASNDAGSQCRPFGIPRHLGTTDQTTLD